MKAPELDWKVRVGRSPGRSVPDVVEAAVPGMRGTVARVHLFGDPHTDIRRENKPWAVIEKHGERLWSRYSSGFGDAQGQAAVAAARIAKRNEALRGYGQVARRGDAVVVYEGVYVKANGILLDFTVWDRPNMYGKCGDMLLQCGQNERPGASNSGCTSFSFGRKSIRIEVRFPGLLQHMTKILGESS